MFAVATSRLLPSGSRLVHRERPAVEGFGRRVVAEQSSVLSEVVEHGLDRVGRSLLADGQRFAMETRGGPDILARPRDVSERVQARLDGRAFRSEGLPDRERPVVEVLGGGEIAPPPGDVAEPIEARGLLQTAGFDASGDRQRAFVERPGGGHVAALKVETPEVVERARGFEAVGRETLPEAQGSAAEIVGRFVFGGDPAEGAQARGDGRAVRSDPLPKDESADVEVARRSEIVDGLFDGSEIPRAGRRRSGCPERDGPRSPGPSGTRFSRGRARSGAAARRRMRRAGARGSTSRCPWPGGSQSPRLPARRASFPRERRPWRCATSATRRPTRVPISKVGMRRPSTTQARRIPGPRRVGAHPRCRPRESESEAAAASSFSSSAAASRPSVPGPGATRPAGRFPEVPVRSRHARGRRAFRDRRWRNPSGRVERPTRSRTAARRRVRSPAFAAAPPGSTSSTTTPAGATVGLVGGVRATAARHRPQSTTTARMFVTCSSAS